MGAMLMGSVLQAADRLTLYCSPQIEWCELMVNTFEKQTGIRVSMTRKSSGETLAQIKAEKSNPKGDVWWGGTGDPHLQAAEEGLTEVYNSPMLSQLQDWALSPHKATGG
ncbi:MAG: substrate-binding domain-containing protein, partial [bacterium]